MSRAEGRVVVGVNGSLGSLEALRRGVDIARGTQRRLDVVRVWQPTVCSYNKADFSITSRPIARREQHNLDESIAQALGTPPPDLDLRTTVRGWEGNAGRVLTWLANREDDLLVLGSSHRGLLSWMRPRSVGRYCVRHARCPLLVVPLPALARSVWSRPFQTKRLVRAITSG